MTCRDESLISRMSLSRVQVAVLWGGDILDADELLTTLHDVNVVSPSLTWMRL